jgi:hypothetical protein
MRGVPPITGSKHALFIFFAAPANSTNQASITYGCTTQLPLPYRSFLAGKQSATSAVKG